MIRRVTERRIHRGGTEVAEKTVGKEETLNERKLSILRAALQYFHEEVCQHGAEAIEDYLPGESVSPEEVRALRAELNEVQLRYVDHAALEPLAGSGRVAVLVTPSKAR